MESMELVESGCFCWTKGKLHLGLSTAIPKRALKELYRLVGDKIPHRGRGVEELPNPESTSNTETTNKNKWQGLRGGFPHSSSFGFYLSLDQRAGYRDPLGGNVPSRKESCWVQLTFSYFIPHPCFCLPSTSQSTAGGLSVKKRANRKPASLLFAV